MTQVNVSPYLLRRLRTYKEYLRDKRLAKGLVKKGHAIPNNVTYKESL